MSGSRISQLSIVCAGHVHTEAFEPLTAHLTRIEQVVTNLPPRIAFADARAELNRAIDAAAHDWILIMRERETIDAPLASEIAAALQEPRAWGFRIETLPLYAGKPLRLGAEGELRLLHRRHLLRRGALQVEGTIVRMQNSFHALTFESADAHRAYLMETASRRSLRKRALVFLRTARTADINTLRYLWIEAGFESR